MTAGDPYRDRVRRMSATEHFATDYRPVRPVRPTGMCRCDSDPGVFRVFTFAVLALHDARRPRGDGDTATCSCGRSADACPIRSLAEALLFAPEPLPDAP